MNEPRWKQYYSEEEFVEILSDKSRWHELEEFYTRQSVRNWARRYDIDIGRSGPPSKFDDVTREQWIEWIWEDGYTVQDMSRSWDMANSSICYQLDKHNVPYPKERWEIHFSLEELRALLAKGRPGFNKIQEKTGVCRRTVARWRDEYYPEWRDNRIQES